MGTRVLVVDDEQWFAEALVKRLTQRGFSVSCVSGGLQAIDVVHDQDTDVVVLDVMLPDLNGRETLKRILDLRPEIKVIMLTAHGTIEDAVTDLRLGATNYLQKPCDIEVLVRAIEQAAGTTVS
jgi:DNA-binding NtrC family response regulator